MMNREWIRQRYGRILDPGKRIDFRLTYECLFGIPNTDPDTGGPRMLPDDRIFVTDVCLKRSIRDYLEDRYEREMYVSRKAAREGKSLREHTADCVEPQKALARFWDLRMMGGLMILGAKKTKKDKASKKAEAPENVEGAGEEDADSENGNGGTRVLGPLQIGYGVSTEPVVPMEIGLTRLISTNPVGSVDENQTMGRRTLVEKVVIIQVGRYSGHLGSRTGVTSEDLLDLFDGILNMFDTTRRSTMRGEQRLLKLEVVPFKDAYGHEADGLVVLEPGVEGWQANDVWGAVDDAKRVQANASA